MSDDDDDMQDEEISFKIVCRNKTMQCISVIQIQSNSAKYLRDITINLKVAHLSYDSSLSRQRNPNCKTLALIIIKSCMNKLCKWRRW